MGASRIRQTLNAIGCTVIVAVCLFLFISLATSVSSLPPPKPDDPDGGKAILIYLSGIVVVAFVGVTAVVSLIRSVNVLRESKSAGVQGKGR